MYTTNIMSVDIEISIDICKPNNQRAWNISSKLKYEIKSNWHKPPNLHFISKPISFFSAQIINSAAHQNREEVLQKSREMKFLTGYESKVVLLSDSLLTSIGDDRVLQFI